MGAKMKNKIVHKIIVLFTILVSSSILIGCNEQIINKDNSNQEVTKENVGEEELFTKEGNLPIKDNFSLYENWDYDEVVTMYLTVRTGNESEGSNHTWEEVNTYSAYYYDELGVERYKVEGLLQIGDENGPIEGELGYGQYVPNSIVQIRGQTSTRNSQKNYRISIRDDKGDWKGQTTINLNKHKTDRIRFTNMFCYKLMSEIDGMMSARTKFVHLYVKDETESGDGSDTFVDYGLFTQVEQINRTYLRNHNLDRNGQLYKINFFEFYPYEDVIMLRSDSNYDLKEFEKYLEVKGNDDHSKLIKLLQELNDYSIPIEEVFEKWFDEENYFSWLAFHILVGNKDTSSRNYFLYSPNNINKFYFISWDNDFALSKLSFEYANWKDGLAHEEGISNYWGSILHRRVLQSEEYRAKLDQRIEEIKSFLSEEKLRTEANHLAEIVKPYIYSMPDVEHAECTSTQYDDIIAHIPNEVQSNYEDYKESLNKPMPFFLGIPTVENNQLKFNWDMAYEFDQETIHYKLQLCNDFEFLNCIYEEDGMLIPEIKIDNLPAGQYFYRVTAKNTSGYEQMAFDYYNSKRGKEYGMMCFWITEDGEVKVDGYVE